MKKIDLPLKEMIQMYESGISCAAIAKHYNVSATKIQTTLIKNNIEIRKGGSYRRDYNQDFFNEINTEEKAYWLGFLYADGCIRLSKNNQHIISLTSIDKEVIEKFHQSINLNQEIKTYKNNVYKTTLTSITMFNDLKKLGCIENKSLILNFPNENQVPNNLISHFIRGYFDGDGSVCTGLKKNPNKTNTKYEYIQIHICGTLEFLTGLNKIINKKEPKKEKRKETNTWYLSFSGTKNVNSFYEFIYKNATVFLERKLNKFINYYKDRCSETTISHPTNEGEGIVQPYMKV